MSDTGQDPLDTVREFKNRPARVGCLGCTFTGPLGIAFGILLLALAIYLLRRLF